MTTRELDPQAAATLRELAEFEVGSAADADAQRRTFKAILARITDAHLHRFDGTVSDAVLGIDGLSVPVRRYEPHQARAGAGVVYFHGGGWMFGDLDTGSASRARWPVRRRWRSSPSTTGGRRRPSAPPHSTTASSPPSTRARSSTSGARSPATAPAATWPSPSPSPPDPAVSTTRSSSSTPASTRRWRERPTRPSPTATA